MYVERSTSIEYSGFNNYAVTIAEYKGGPAHSHKDCPVPCLYAIYTKSCFTLHCTVQSNQIVNLKVLVNVDSN